MQYKLEIMEDNGKFYWNAVGEKPHKTRQEAITAARKAADDIIESGCVNILEKALEISEN